MQKFGLSSLLWMCICVVIADVAVAQAPSDSSSQVIWRVETIDGNEYVGEIVERTAAYLKINTQTLGLLQIPMDQIKRVEEIEPDRIKSDGLWLENKYATRYFLAPSGYGLGRGEAYYQNTWVLFNQFSWGMGRNFSMGFGLLPGFLFGGGSTPVWITPKLSFPAGKQGSRLSFGAGLLAATSLGDEGGVVGMGYGVMTFGSRDNNVNVGLGYGVIEGERVKRPTVTISAMVRTGKRGYFITENYIIPIDDEVQGVISFGGRLVRKAMAVDLGVFAPITGETFEFALPWLSVILPMGRSK